MFELVWAMVIISFGYVWFCLAKRSNTFEHLPPTRIFKHVQIMFNASKKHTFWICSNMVTFKHVWIIFKHSTCFNIFQMITHMQYILDLFKGSNTYSRFVELTDLHNPMQPKYSPYLLDKKHTLSRICCFPGNSYSERACGFAKQLQRQHILFWPGMGVFTFKSLMAFNLNTCGMLY